MRCGSSELPSADPDNDLRLRVGGLLGADARAVGRNQCLEEHLRFDLGVVDVEPVATVLDPVGERGLLGGAVNPRRGDHRIRVDRLEGRDDCGVGGGNIDESGGEFEYPLNSLKMALSVLKQNLDSFSPETISEYVDRGLADIGRMEYLLKSLKTFSIFEHVDFKDLPLAEFMGKFLSLIERDFQSHGIHIQLDSPLDIARVRIDKRALHQALLNIFNNAADALQGQSDPQIRISAELRGQLVWLRISDNGCGILPEQKKHLFQPFNTNKPHGNGLGLVITRKLLAMMDSDIDIESQPKVGTQVTISLPVSPENNAAEDSATEAAAAEQDKL